MFPDRQNSAVAGLASGGGPEQVASSRGMQIYVCPVSAAHPHTDLIQ
jgi:hypothetical protein